jgi:hypothetical protein
MKKRIRWPGHVERIGEMRYAQTVSVRKLETKTVND